MCLGLECSLCLDGRGLSKGVGCSRRGFRGGRWVWVGFDAVNVCFVIFLWVFYGF